MVYRDPWAPVQPSAGQFHRYLATKKWVSSVGHPGWPTKEEQDESWAMCSVNRFLSLFDVEFTAGGFLYDNPQDCEMRDMDLWIYGGTSYRSNPMVSIQLQPGSAGTLTLKPTFKVPFFLWYSTPTFGIVPWTDNYDPAQDTHATLYDLTQGHNLEQYFTKSMQGNEDYFCHGIIDNGFGVGSPNGSSCGYGRLGGTRWSFDETGRSTGGYSSTPYGIYYWYEEQYENMPIVLPPTSELQWKYHFTNQTVIQIDNFWVQLTLWDQTENYGEIFSSASGYYSEENLRALTMTGQAAGPCQGEAYSSPVLSKAQVCWCGYACTHEESLRNSFIGLEGRSGMVFDESHPTFYMTTQVEEAAPYFNCNPEVELFIQTVPSEDEEHQYSFRTGKNSVWGDGMLEGSDLLIPYSTDHGSYPLASEDEEWRLVGPKSFINYGLSGDVWHYWYFNTTDYGAGKFTIEPLAPLSIDPTFHHVYVDEGTASGFFAFELGERTTGYTMYTHTTLDVKATVSFPYQAMKGKYFCGIELVENGTTYDVYLNVFSFNFTTEAIVEESSTLLWSDEPRPLLYSFGGRIAWAPTHGTDGRLYISQVHWTGSKSNEGRVRVFNWSDSTNTFTEGTAWTWAQRNGYAGTCISWDDYSDHLLVGMLIDEIWGMDSTGSNINQYDGRDRDSECGLAFVVGDGTLIYQNSTVPRIYMGNYGVSGFSSMDNLGSTQTAAFRNVVMDAGHYEGGLGGGLQPHFCAMVDNAFTVKTTYYHYSSGWQLSTSNYAHCSCNDSRLDIDSWYYRKGTNHYRYTDQYLGGGIAGESDTTFPYSWDKNPMNYAIIVDDGVDEYLINIYLNTTQLSQHAFWTKVGEKIDTHTELGKHYIECITSVATGVAITDFVRVTYDTDTGFNYVYIFFKLDNDPNYYTAHVTSGLVSYSTWQDAFDNAARSIYLDAADITPLDISETDEITWWFVLEKQFDELSPTTTPKAYRLELELETPGKTEPVIERHFGDGQDIAEIFKNTSQELKVYTTVTPDAQAVDMVVTGTYNRSPL